MDAIEPILPNPSILPEVRATQRAAPVRRDGRQGDGPPNRRRRRQPAAAGVELDVEGVDGSDDATAEAEGPVTVPELPAPRSIDLTADDEVGPRAHRIDLTA
ncbi:MAG TPA: hypothetical protein VKV21_01530 [Solirubrobacteraceae bacterium]|nr:hypothetical protein [Solirubrobacteraceae bacterium]